MGSERRSEFREPGRTTLVGGGLRQRVNGCGCSEYDECRRNEWKNGLGLSDIATAYRNASGAYVGALLAQRVIDMSFCELEVSQSGGGGSEKVIL
jgi:hypothetical protein